MNTQKSCMKKKLQYGFYSFIIISLLNSAVSFGQIGEPKFNSALEETWNNGAWENSFTITNTYDDNNYLINSLTQSWENAAWVKSYQSNYNNNPNGTIQQATMQNWTTQWENLQRTTYTYTGANKESSTITDLWSETEWMSFSRTNSTYDANNYLIKLVTEINYFVEWSNSVQIIYENNADGTVKIETLQSWSDPNWVNIGKTIYDYYPGKKEKTATNQTWIGETWVNSDLDTNTYDGNGNLTNTLSQIWNASNSSWSNDSQTLYTDYVNGNGLPKYIIDQLWVTDESGSKWVNSFRITINYGALGTQNFDSKKNYTLYPNPAHDRITIGNNNQIQGENYSIIDQTGRICLNGTLNSNQTAIDLYSLSKGMYFVQLGQNRNQTFKIIKE